MPIQRSLIASSEGRPVERAARRGITDFLFRPWRLYSHVGLLLLTLLLSGCDALPGRPRFPDLPFLQLGKESNEAAQIIRIFLPEEGEVTEALRGQITSWAAAKELQVDLYSAAPYDRELRDRLAGNEPPDLVVVSSFLFPELVAEGLLAPAERGLLDPEGYSPQLAEAFTQPSDQPSPLRYCLPREVRTLALVYDSEGLAAASQTPPTDWDTMWSVAVDQTDLERNRFGFIEAPDLSRWLPFLYAAGGTIIDEHGTMTLESPAASSALDWYIRIFRENFAGHAGESNSEWPAEVLGKGKGAIAFEGNWIVPYYASEFPAYRYGVAPLPAGPAKLNTSIAFTSCYAVSARSTRKTEAFELAVFLTSSEVVGSLPNDGGWMPAQASLRDSWTETFPHLAAFADAVPAARVWQFPPGFAPFLHGFNRGMVHLFAAQVEAEDFLADMQELGETLLAEASDQESSSNDVETSER